MAETNRLCVSRGGLMFMGSGPLAQHVSFPPARLQASLWLGPRQVAQQRLSQVGLGVAVPSSQNWAPAQAPMDGYFSYLIYSGIQKEFHVIHTFTAIPNNQSFIGL